jgi:hypothetical protein
MSMLIGWMRIVGFVYLIKFFIMAIIKAPEIFETKFLFDEMMIGVEWGVLGAILITFSRSAEQAAALIWAILIIEFFWILYDIYILTQGHDSVWFGAWIGIHIIITISGIIALRKATPLRAT